MNQHNSTSLNRNSSFYTREFVYLCSIPRLQNRYLDVQVFFLQKTASSIQGTSLSKSRIQSQILFSLGLLQVHSPQTQLTSDIQNYKQNKLLTRFNEGKKKNKKTFVKTFEVCFLIQTVKSENIKLMLTLLMLRKFRVEISALLNCVMVFSFFSSFLFCYAEKW